MTDKSHAGAVYLVSSRGQAGSRVPAGIDGGTAEQRVAAFLLGLSEKFAENGLTKGNFHLPLSRHDIAGQLELAVEAVSVACADLRRRGLIEVNRRHVIIRDADALAALAD